MGRIALIIWDAIDAIEGDKGQVVADFLADHLVSGSSKFYDDLPDEIVEVNTTQSPQKNKYGNYFLTEHQEQVLREISLQVWGQYLFPHSTVQ